LRFSPFQASTHADGEGGGGGECIRGKYLCILWRRTRGHAEQLESALRDSKRVWRLEVELLNVPFEIKCTDLQALTVDFL
jgi:hypothetical protein